MKTRMKAVAEVLSQYELDGVGEVRQGHGNTTGLEVCIYSSHTPGMQEGILDLGYIAPGEDCTLL